MRFEVEHEFPGTPAAVLDVLCDAMFHTGLDLPDVSRPDVVEQSTDGTSRLLKLRYAYTGRLDPIAQRVVGGRELSWIQELRIDARTFVGTLSFSAENDPNRVNGAADVVITSLDDGDDPRAQRRIAGDLHIRIPVVGGTAERRMVPGLVRRLDVEATALRAALAARR